MGKESKRGDGKCKRGVLFWVQMTERKRGLNCVLLQKKKKELKVQTTQNMQAQ